MANPLLCERCGGDLETDDAVSIIEGVCAPCRGAAGLGWLADADSLQPRPAPSAPDVDLSIFDILAEPEPTKSSRRARGSAAAKLPSLRGHGHIPIPDREAFRRATAGAPASESKSDVQVHKSPPVPGPSIPTAKSSHPGFLGSRRDARVGDSSEYVLPPLPAVPIPGAPRIEQRRHALKIGMVGGFLVTVGLSGYFLFFDHSSGDLSMSSGATVPVTLRVVPRSAAVLLDGEEMTASKADGIHHLSIPADGGGIKTLVVSAEGYQTIRQPISIFHSVSDVTIELIPEPYQVTIQTHPPDAEVRLAGQFKGKTPLVFTVADPAKASIKIRHPGFLDASPVLAPEGESRKIELMVELEPSAPRILVQTEPVGAEILIDGAPKGRAPLEIALEGYRWGDEVQLEAGLPGHDPISQRIRLPAAATIKPLATKLVLTQGRPALEVLTNPPGARVRIEGRDLGQAPILVRFNPEQIGQSVLVQASLDGVYAGRQHCLIPAAGAARQVTIPLSFTAQRVVFVFASDPAERAAHLALSDDLIDRIHRLNPSQQFALVTQSSDAPVSWPGDLEAPAASSEQKVRAYDFVRAGRSTRPAAWPRLLERAIRLQPSAVWILSSTPLNQDDLRTFADAASENDIAVSIVRCPATSADQWLQDWTAVRNGEFVPMSPGPEKPAIALQPDTDD